MSVKRLTVAVDLFNRHYAPDFIAEATLAEDVGGLARVVVKRAPRYGEVFKGVTTLPAFAFPVPLKMTRGKGQWLRMVEQRLNAAVSALRAT